MELSTYDGGTVCIYNNFVTELMSSIGGHAKLQKIIISCNINIKNNLTLVIHFNALCISALRNKLINVEDKNIDGTI